MIGRLDPMGTTMPARLLLALLLAVPAVATAQSAGGSPNRRCEDATSKTIEALQSSRFKDATEGFGAALRARMGEDDLAKAWNGMPEKDGELRTIGRLHAGTVGGHPEVYVPLMFASATWTLRIACASDGTITDLAFKPPRR